MEFSDFRSYVPGDDLRRVDWNLYQRSGRLFLKLFEELEDLPLYVLLDVSDSMFFENPPRADEARRTAALVAAAGLNRLDSISLHPFGSDLWPPLEFLSGKRSLNRALNYLESLEGRGATDMRKSLGRFAAARRRSGLAVVISDFFDPGGVEAVLDALRALPHRILLVQVVRASDAEPSIRGERRFLDCESSLRVDVSVTAEVLAAYQKAYGTFCENLLNFAAQRRGALLKLDADRSVLEQLDLLFPGGEFVI